MAKGFGDIVKQAQQIQERLQEAQEASASKTVEATAGGGMVTATVSGRLELVALTIDPAVLEGGDTDMLRDLVMAAVNEGIRRAQQMMAEEMGKITGGLGLPFKIPGLG
jgi:DNA-binding YbaB/EbfC family protein